MKHQRCAQRGLDPLSRILAEAAGKRGGCGAEHLPLPAKTLQHLIHAQGLGSQNAAEPAGSCRLKALGRGSKSPEEAAAAAQRRSHRAEQRCLLLAALPNRALRGCHLHAEPERTGGAIHPL